MADHPPVSEELGVRETKILKNFKTLTGYEDEDIAAYNFDAMVVVTYNGGKYRMNKSATQVQVLSGPTPPKMAG
jgi:hypothetical protein